MNGKKQIVQQKRKEPSVNLTGYFAAVKMVTDNEVETLASDL